MASLCRMVLVPKQFCRQLSVSVICNKEIKHSESDKKIVVEGIMEAKQNNFSKEFKSGCGNHQCHPFCKSPIVSEVKHTDVLILDQFIDSKGEMYSREDLRICMVSSH